MISEYLFFSFFRQKKRTIYLVIFIVFSTGLFSSLATRQARARNLKIVSLPSDVEYLSSVRLTNKILKPLFLEYRHKLREANTLWRELPQNSKSVQEHVFKTDLAVLSYEEFPKVPHSGKSFILMSKYYSWQKKWYKAAHMIEDRREKFVLDRDLQLELARLNICLGKYEKAEKILFHFESSGGREEIQHDILWAWLYILTGRSEEAERKIKKMEEDFLYLPYSAIFPADNTSSQEKLEKNLRQALVRFPSNSTVFEQMVRLTLEKHDWKTLEGLLDSQRFISKVSLAWPVRAELYLRTGKQKKLTSLLNKLDRDEITPEFFDIIARNAIRNGDWNLLKNVAEAFTKRFPDLLDGELYFDEYRRLTRKNE